MSQYAKITFVLGTPEDYRSTQPSPSPSGDTAPAPPQTTGASRARTRSRPYPSPADRDCGNTLPTSRVSTSSNNTGTSSTSTPLPPLKVSAVHLYYAWYRRKYTSDPSRIPMTTLGNGQPKNLQKQIMDRWKVASAEERGEWQTVATKYRKDIERGRLYSLLMRTSWRRWKRKDGFQPGRRFS
ncbi:hypothetical protein FA13DRAFT_1742259, partial [Coprinellus micaceus]